MQQKKPSDGVGRWNWDYYEKGVGELFVDKFAALNRAVQNFLSNLSFHLTNTPFLTINRIFDSANKII